MWHVAKKIKNKSKSKVKNTPQIFVISFGRLYTIHRYRRPWIALLLVGNSRDKRKRFNWPKMCVIHSEPYPIPVKVSVLVASSCNSCFPTLFRRRVRTSVLCAPERKASLQYRSSNFTTRAASFIALSEVAMFKVATSGWREAMAASRFTEPFSKVSAHAKSIYNTLTYCWLLMNGDYA